MRGLHSDVVLIEFPNSHYGLRDTYSRRIQIANYEFKDVVASSFPALARFGPPRPTPPFRTPALAALEALRTERAAWRAVRGGLESDAPAPVPLGGQYKEDLLATAEPLRARRQRRRRSGHKARPRCSGRSSTVGPCKALHSLNLPSHTQITTKANYTFSATYSHLTLPPTLEEPPVLELRPPQLPWVLVFCFLLPPDSRARAGREKHTDSPNTIHESYWK